MLSLCRFLCLQLFDAPPLVRHALNNVCGLDTTYVMSVHDLDKARAMMEQQKGVHKVYSPEVGVRVASKSLNQGMQQASRMTGDYDQRVWPAW